MVRVKKRFLLLQFRFPPRGAAVQEVSGVVGALAGLMRDLYGDVGAALCRGQLAVRFHSTRTNSALLSVPRRVATRVRAALTLLSSIDRAAVGIDVLRVTGSPSAARRLLRERLTAAAGGTAEEQRALKEDLRAVEAARLP
eukprot:Hpha_TRINITY_DN27901_c0_g1::TRINITY_DN27901_c0_g1_i1::g.45012::m.45012/K03537/POP5; ribonuclease P/MRP protein subunit POP5